MGRILIFTAELVLAAFLSLSLSLSLPFSLPKAHCLSPPQTHTMMVKLIRSSSKYIFNLFLLPLFSSSPLSLPHQFNRSFSFSFFHLIGPGHRSDKSSLFFFPEWILPSTTPCLLGGGWRKSDDNVTNPGIMSSRLVRFFRGGKKCSLRLNKNKQTNRFLQCLSVTFVQHFFCYITDLNKMSFFPVYTEVRILW